MKVAVVGKGNVGTQMARIFGVEPISSRTLDGLDCDTDLCIIAVSDSAVKEVADRLPHIKGVVAHTTGSVPMETLKNVKCDGYGVLYPFQTISKSRPLPPSSIPLIIEGRDCATTDFLINAARQYGFTNIQQGDSEMRRKVHLAGVFACNFPNASIAISQKILSECGIDGKIVAPLVAETVEKLKTLPAKEAQTGPAIRHDISTLEKHEALLKELGMNAEADIYRSISDLIMNG